MTLYKGVLFPNAIYVRRVSNGGLNRAYPYGFENYGKEMPYAVLHGDHVEIHKNNGGQKIFELWLKDNLSKDGLVTLYRSGLDLEYELQALIFKMKKLDLKKAADASEVSHLQKISQKLSERGYEDLHRNLDYVLKKIGNISRGQLISDLLQELGGISGGIFTTPSSKAVQSFPDEGNLIMVYKFPVDKLIQMFSLNQIYVGIEFGYIEIAFIDSVENQQSKSILIDSLTGTLKK